MTLVYITDQIYLHGGIERVLANKVNYFVNELNYEVHIITTEQKNNIPCYEIDSKVILHDLAINYNRNKSYFNPLNLIKVPKHYLSLKRKIKAIKPNVIVVCNFAFDFYFIPFVYPEIAKIKEFHSSRHFFHQKRLENKSLFTNFFNKINDYIESKYHCLVLLTTDEKKYYKSNNLLVIPNSIDKHLGKIANTGNSKKVISAGRIAPVKGFEKLINAWSLVAQKHPDWVLDIYGFGEKEYIKSLENLISSLNINDKIVLCGSTNNINEKMLDSAIYVMTSETECFPMVLLEAMSNGLPIVSFDCPNGPRNIFTNNVDGILVEQNNIKAFANAIINLIEAPEKRIFFGKNGHNSIEKFNTNKIMNCWRNLFIDVSSFKFKDYS
ncbi:glycosyltransferase family 4 protein [Mariniflexile gromovii]|uniref:Glycosyltransferase family 4 protein n=1 Tax=Mariniflexile gromovii TaxID=362523 RepID=A0ABS4BQU7_9FLAO|nr:glycosyltransferase family 4 protein [Mariniflexile gromovii]MBP0902472.1 glycosyltransferase family 4 protein [Mariniflexile gromovii]